MDDKGKEYINNLLEAAITELKGREECLKDWKNHMESITYKYSEEKKRAGEHIKDHVDKIAELTWRIEYFKKILESGLFDGIKKYR